jgi:hypothetical protein
MSNESAVFTEFMKGREAIAEADVTGDARRLTGISAQHDPVTFFGPRGGQVVGAADVLARRVTGS